MKQRDIPLTRADVFALLADFDGQLKPTKKLEKHLRTKLGAELADTKIDTHERASMQDTTPLIDMILSDIQSYG